MMKGKNEGLIVCVVESVYGNPVHLNVFLKARHERENQTLNIPWTYNKQESVFKVGEFSVALFTAEPAVVLVYDLLVTV